jgi:hypothetical protein
VEISTYILLFGILSIVIILFVSPTIKVLVSFIVMNNLFDLVPKKVYGVALWDVGIVLLLISWIHIIVVGRKHITYSSSYIKVLKVFMAVLVLSFLWSVLVYRYPLLLTIKCAREMVLGYLSLFVFLALFESYENSFRQIMSALYMIAYLLSAIHVIQYISGVPIFRGYMATYAGSIRGIPNVLPIAVLFMWRNLSIILAGEKTHFLDKAYVILIMVVLLTTFTRGIYFAVLMIAMLLVSILIIEGRLKINRSIIVIYIVASTLVLVLPSGKLDSVLERAQSGIDMLFSKSSKKSDFQRNSYRGRIALLEERVKMVATKNVIIGYGFMHEDIATKKVKIRVGTPQASGELGFFSADIAWANLVIYTGFLGVMVFVCFVLSLIVSYFRNIGRGRTGMYHIRLSLFLQTLFQVVVMMNGSSFTSAVQIPCFLIAGYAYCSKRGDV